MEVILWIMLAGKTQNKIKILKLDVFLLLELYFSKLTSTTFLNYELRDFLMLSFGFWPNFGSVISKINVYLQLKLFLLTFTWTKPISLENTALPLISVSDVTRFWKPSQKYPGREWESWSLSISFKNMYTKCGKMEYIYKVTRSAHAWFVWE